jgi:hypothetical protein
MKKGMITAAAVLTLTAVTGYAWAGAGVSGAQILQQDLGARPAGLAGAYTALGGDIDCLGWNPAGLADLTHTELTFMHFGGIEGLGTQWLAGATPIPGLGTLGGQFVYQGQPAIDNAVDGEAAVEVLNMAFGVSYATGILPGLRAGLNAQAVLMTLGPSNTSTLAVDAGVQYSLDELTRFGAAIRHLGQDVKFRAVADPLPLTAALGASRVLLNDGPHSFTVDIDAAYLAPEKNLSLLVGGEYAFKRMVALRLGYAYSAQKTINSFSAGLGLRFKVYAVEVKLDYSLQPQFWEQSDFDLQNLISLGTNF